MSENSKAKATKAFERLHQTVRELREKCPWDREQNLLDTTRHLLEEAYETVDAIGAGDTSDIAEELGDLIVQSLFVAVILSEQTPHGIKSILKAANAKLIRRHPHVYNGAEAVDVETVIENWDKIKQAEAAKKGNPKGLKSTGRALPALMRAEKLGEKARRRGMDWGDIHAVLAKIREEIDEVETALGRDDRDAAAVELGDMMLAMANAPRFIGHNAEQTLRRACDKFVVRFEALSKLARSRKLNLRRLNAAAIDGLWQEMKSSEPTAKSSNRVRH
jgi:tetrapyrrole methylase family protein / MazG family protein